jgi:hypothetical protein
MGLLPLWFYEDDIPKLVVKAPKEVILAAKINQGFNIYVVPVCIQTQNTMGLVSAFFDNEDEPLIISTPMFDEPGTKTLRDILLCSRLDIYFFDENNRELLGYTATIECTAHTQSLIEKAALLPFDLSSAKLSFRYMTEWFGNRNVQDDISAMAIKFDSALFAEDLFIQDLRPQNHSYHGSESFSHSQLEREEPGPFQERDIVQLLHRVFLPEQIYLDPLRVTDREEIADIMVVTNSNILFIQAKDSPNTERLARNTITRKKATTQKNLKKAVNQTKGALRYAVSRIPMRLISGNKEIEIILEGREIRSLVIVKELFNDEYSVYSDIILPMAEETQVPCIPLDYTELHMYTSNLREEDDFFSAYDRVFFHGVESGIFPRLRFGLTHCN